jgi:fructokinase
MSKFRILGVGELLWDMLPAGPQLGGAPANFSVMAARLGDDVALMSRLGNDTLGELALDRLGKFPIERSLIQHDARQPTGQVNIEIAGGQPSYIFQEPSAWDFLELTEEWRSEAARADAICFGTLAQRASGSRETIQGLLRATRPGCIRICDANLRAPYFSAGILRISLELATVLKLNDVEMPQVMELLELSQPDLELSKPGMSPLEKQRLGAERILEKFPQLTLVAVTWGEKGSLLVSRSEWHYHAGIPAQVVDTVGAGDAFNAALTHYLLRGASLPTLNEAGNRWGSYIASRAGAMPEIGPEVFENITRAIEG